MSYEIPKGEPLTLETMRAAYEQLLKHEERPAVEYHHPRCPKITTGGAKACRCGAAPFEAIFEDDLARRPGSRGADEGKG